MTHQPPYPGGVITRFTGVTCLGILLAALVLLPLVAACACAALLLLKIGKTTTLRAATHSDS